MRNQLRRVATGALCWLAMVGGANGQTARPIVAIDGSAPSTTATTAVVIVNNNVGVGTASPAYRLDVQGGKINASEGFCIAGDCKGSWPAVAGSLWDISGTTINYTAGNVGIGTTTPGGVLEVSGGHYDTTLRLTSNHTSGTGIRLSNTGSGGQTFNIVSTGSANGGGAGRLGFFDASFGNFVMSLTAGRVGVGTTSPERKLHVSDDAAGLTFPLVVGNAYADVVDYGASILFRAGTGLNRGKGGIAYVYDSSASWNKGDFHILQNSAANTDTPTLADAVVTVKNNGNVGIGTTTPTARLQVVGDVVVSGNIGAKYQDVAEWVEALEPVSAGTVVSADRQRGNVVRRSQGAYETAVAGVVSAQPGVLLGESGAGRVAVAQSGRVRVNVDASFGSIEPGDLLVSSPRAGYAMKSQPVMLGDTPIHRPGTILGKALEALPSGDGEILVLLTLQ